VAPAISAAATITTTVIIITAAATTTTTSAPTAASSASSAAATPIPSTTGLNWRGRLHRRGPYFWRRRAGFKRARRRNRFLTDHGCRPISWNRALVIHPRRSTGSVKGTRLHVLPGQHRLSRLYGLQRLLWLHRLHGLLKLLRLLRLLKFPWLLRLLRLQESWSTAPRIIPVVRAIERRRRKILLRRRLARLLCWRRKSPAIVVRRTGRLHRRLRLGHRAMPQSRWPGLRGSLIPRRSLAIRSMQDQ
jgi:hypothetical protein